MNSFTSNHNKTVRHDMTSLEWHRQFFCCCIMLKRPFNINSSKAHFFRCLKKHVILIYSNINNYPIKYRFIVEACVLCIRAFFYIIYEINRIICYVYKPEGICIQGSKLSSAQAIINFVEVYMPN